MCVEEISDVYHGPFKTVPWHFSKATSITHAVAMS